MIEIKKDRKDVGRDETLKYSLYTSLEDIEGREHRKGAHL